MPISWASPVTLVNAEAFDATEEFSGDIDLETTGYCGVHITVDVTFHTSGTYGATISLYGSLDGTNYDDIPLFSQGMTKVTGAQQISIPIDRPIPHLRLGFKTTADENDSYLPTVTIIHQRYGWSAT